jgi:uroporphyrinogen-III synthase
VALVINTRPPDRSGELSDLLRQAGFDPVEIPLVGIEPEEEGLARMRKLQPNSFTGIFLSSPSGIRILADGLLPHEMEAWIKKPFYLVGGKSASFVESLGGKVNFFPKEASLEGFLKEYSPSAAARADVNSGLTALGMVLAQRWLHPCSLSTRLEPAAFKQRGIDVENIPVYRPGLPADAGAKLAKEGAGADAVVFCSGSAVANFFASAPEMAARLGKADGPLAVTIGPSATKALADRGVEKIGEALSADNMGLVDALKSAFGGTVTKALKKKNPETKA